MIQGVADICQTCDGKTKNAGKGYIQTATAPPTFAFDCYVVLDIEATCDNEKKMEPQEIIEFPLVLVDPKTLKQVDEFRTSVRDELS